MGGLGGVVKNGGYFSKIDNTAKEDYTVLPKFYPNLDICKLELFCSPIVFNRNFTGNGL